MPLKALCKDKSSESCTCMMFIVVIGIEMPGIHFQDQNTDKESNVFFLPEV